MPKPTIADQFNSDHAQRREILERARLCAALSKPQVLPPEDQQSDQKLPESYQSLGSRGILNMEGRMLLALFPPNQPWFQFIIKPQIFYDPRVPDEVKQMAMERLRLAELQIQATLDSAELKNGRHRRRGSFRSRKRMVLSQVLVTGDALEQLTDDYRVKLFRRDQYVTKRDSSTDVLYHITKERIDPLSLTDRQINDAGLDKLELKEHPVYDRMQDLHTRCEWQPQRKRWLIEQEINEKVIHRSEDEVSPFIATPFELAPGENYGRGFIELNLGELRTLNELESDRLDILALAAKQLPVMDQGCIMREEDLENAKSGSILRGKVRNGVVQDIAMLGFENVREYQMLTDGIKDKSEKLGSAMLLVSATTRDAERVTATERRQIAVELDGALGGLYAPIADEQQLPMLQRVVYQMKRDKKLTALPEDIVDIHTLTGINAINRDNKAGSLLELTQVIASLGPEAMQHIDIGQLIKALARYKNIDEPGFVKSDEQVQQERAQALQEQAAQQAVQTAGNIVEERVKQQGQGLAA